MMQRSTGPSFDGVLVRTTWDYTERIAEYLAWAERVAAEIGTPLLNPVEIIRLEHRQTLPA